jgi:hypothetical protein
VQSLTSGEHGPNFTLVKNWLDDPQANYKPHLDFKQYLKTKKSLAKENYNLIEEHNHNQKIGV